MCCASEFETEPLLPPRRKELDPAGNPAPKNSQQDRPGAAPIPFRDCKEEAEDRSTTEWARERKPVWVGVGGGVGGEGPGEVNQP